MSGSPPPAVSVEELHQRLTDAIAQLETGEQWQAWLDFAHQLHRYSFNNLILIWTQRPDASAVASYQTWQTMDRQVRRGEKAIRVLAPMVRRRPVVDDHGQPVRQADGQPQTRQQIIGFRPVPVFDIAQTDGPPPPVTPTPVLLSGHAPAGLWEALGEEISQRGYRLLRGPVDQLGGANGLTKLVEREVWVRDDVDDAQAVKTLTHELAHVILHADPDQPQACAGIREVEAESVAHLVMAAHGVDTAPYTFPYVAAWAHPVAAVDQTPLTDVVARTGSRVIQAAHTILEAVPVAAPEDPAGAGLTARVTASTGTVTELHERVNATQLPPVARDTLLGVIADSHAFFRRHVGSSWVPDYLAGRGLDQAINSHRLGYAPGGWTGLTDHLRSLGYSDDHIEAAGMATRARTGNLIDRFRDRLTIPLRDPDGDLVGFTARRAPNVDDPRTPKYLNTPTTTLFHKHEILYGYTEHTQQLTAGAVPVVCEGPVDAIAIDQTAHHHHQPLIGVASIGTAFTNQHAQRLLIDNRGQAIILAFDGDRAGQAAAEAAWRKLTEHRPVDVRVVVLPDGTDPAVLAATQPGALLAAIRQAQTAATVVAGRQLDEINIDGNAARELSAFRSLCQYVNRVPTDQRPAFLLDLAQRLHVDPGDAATLTADHNPHILMDQITQRARQLDTMITTAQVRAAEMPSPVNDHDHLARSIAQR